MNEVQEARTSQDVASELFTGRNLSRVFNATPVEAKTSYEDLHASFALGGVMPVIWGGPAGTKVQSARLQSRVWQRQAHGSKIELVTNWLQIDVTGAPTDYAVLTLSGRTSDRQFQTLTHYAAITTNAAHASLPVIGKTVALAVPTAVTDSVCVSVDVIQNWQHGRHLVLAEFVAGKDNITL